MKLHRLELAGFGPYRERQVVDFDAFDVDGIFLISGRTGAGKSSILDGVSYALYNSAPRYGGSQLRVRSDHCLPEDATEVVLEFSSGGSTYRITRSPDYERPKSRGTGTTTVAHAARLDERVDGVWITRAAKPRDVAEVLDDVVGLTREQFLQVVLLAQNRFSEFLLAKNDDRQAVLRTLFGTRVYADYQTAAEDRRRQGEIRVARADEGTRVLLAEAERVVAEHGWEGGPEDPDAAASAAARAAAIEAAVPRARYRREVASAASEAAEERTAAAERVLAEQNALRAAQHDRAAVRERLGALEARTAEIEAARRTVTAARQAEVLRPAVEGVERTRMEIAAAAAAVATARAALDELGAEDAAADDETLTAIVDELTGRLATWETIARIETELPRLEDDVRAHERQRVATAQELLSLDARDAEHPRLLAALDTAITAAAVVAGTLDAALEAERVATDALGAADEAERLAPAVRRAEEERAVAAAAATSAAAELSATLRRRLAGHAGELAAQLVDGEPCAVCGSTAHPSPAQPDVDGPVAEEDVAAAETARDTAVDVERAAAVAERALRDRYAVALARAGGQTAEAHAGRLEEARASVARATEARAERERLQAERLASVSSAALAADERQRLAEALALGRESAAAAGQRLADAQAAVSEARGVFGSVRARIEAGELRRDRARRLATALREEAARVAELERRETDLEVRISASAFTDVGAATAAIRDAAVIAEVENELAEHDTALRATRDRLRDLELELAGVPETPVDVAAASAAVASARESRASAADVATRTAVAAERLEELAIRVRRECDESAASAESHAVADGLAAALSGRTPSRMDLETFVLAAELEEIVAAANLRLDDMSAGRYRLRHSDAVAARGAASGLGLDVFDAHTGRARAPQSLSGGESFLASLALALGLAEVVTARAGGTRLDTLFIDEGFGSLDADTLDLAMRTLDSLRRGGRTVGVISHVETMKEQIAARLEVEATPQGPSIIRQESSLPH